jgi:hypothetical protein
MRSRQVAWKKLNNEAYLVSVNKQDIHVLNSVAGFIWGLLEQTLSVGEIVQRVCEEFEVTSREAEDEICSFLDKLRGLDLIELSPAGKQLSTKKIT